MIKEHFILCKSFLLSNFVSFATKTRMSFNASLSAPLTSNLKTRGEVALFGLERDNSSFASSSEGVRGLRAVVRVS